MIQFAVYTTYGGPLLADYSNRVQQPTIAQNEHGYAEASGFVPMGLQEAFQLYDRAGLLHVVFSDQASDVIYEGRLEDVQIQTGGVTLRAFGYSRSLSDTPYTALWSTTDVTQWRVATEADLGTLRPSRWQMDTNNRLFIAPQKGAAYATGADFGMLLYQIPDASSRSIIGVSFDYVIHLPVGWNADVAVSDAGFASYVTLFSLVGAAGTVPGAFHGVFGARSQIVVLAYNNTGAPATYTNETGADFVILTNVRVVTSTTNRVNTTHTVARAAGTNVTATVGSTANMYVGQRLQSGATGPPAIGESVIVKQILSSTQFVADFTAAAAIGVAVQAHVIYADEIVRDIVSAVATLNPTQLSSVTTLMQTPSLDLFEEGYEDMYGADILDRLITRGDTHTPPRQWEWGVAAGRRLYLRPQGSGARTWYVDVSDIDIRRTIDSLYNSIIATYQEAGGRTLRLATATDAASVARYGLTRRKLFGAQTSSAVQAAVQRDAELNDTKDPRPRSGITVRRVMGASGGDWPLSQVRAGDTIVIRNLPPTLSTAIDRIRTFRITRVELDLEANELTIEPESPLPSLAALLAQAMPPPYVTDPWWILVTRTRT